MVSLRGSLSIVLALSIVAASVASAAPASAKPETNGMVAMMKKIDEYTKAGNIKMAGAGLVMVGMMAPKEKEFAQWKAIARKGQFAAKAGDASGLKASCTTCHDKYREAYKTKHPGGGGGGNDVPKPVE